MTEDDLDFLPLTVMHIDREQSSSLVYAGRTA